MKITSMMLTTTMSMMMGQPGMAQNLGVVVDHSSYRPPICIPVGQPCYRTTNQETRNRFNYCCIDESDNGISMMTCEGGPWNSVCKKVVLSSSSSSLNLPLFDPKGPNWGKVNVSQATTTSSSSGHESCPAVMNLGPDLSKSTGYTSGPFPLLGNTNDLDNPKGRESEIGFLVGGNYNAPLAAEIEGNIVVLGNFTIGSSGINSLGWAGVGSGIFPEKGSVFMRVGGNIQGGKTDGETWGMKEGHIEYGGSCTSNPTNKRGGSSYPDELACGSMFLPHGSTMTQKVLDRAPWETMFADLQVKSEYWYSLKPNGVFISSRGGPNENTMVLYAGDDDECLQVFTLDRFDLVDPWSIQLDSSLINKTILINISPYGIDGKKGEVQIQNIGAIYDPWGGHDQTFSAVTKQSILWNFYGATKVTLGPGGGIQFPGSILIPHGDLDMLWPGQDGRTIVKGNVFHNAYGSEFHNYEFDPPCPLPLPSTLFLPQECTTPQPIAPPTPVPVGVPTPVPVTPPTGGCPYGMPGSNACPQDVVSLTTRITTFPTDVSSPITILSQRGNNVTFNISNPFHSGLQGMYYEFTTASMPDQQCLAKTQIPVCGSPITLTAGCTAGQFPDHSLAHGYTMINIWFVDPMMFHHDEGNEIPPCCHPTDHDKGTKAVMFSYKVYCDTKCPSEQNSTRMLLRGGTTTKTKTTTTFSPGIQ